MTSEPSGRFPVPDIVRRRAITQGPPGERWLEQIEETALSLADEWSVTLGNVRTGGSEALVVEAVLQNGREAVLKIGIPSSESGRQEARLLAAAGGRGYAELFRFDGERRAMLLERLGTPLSELGLPAAMQIQIVWETLQEAWLPVPEGVKFMNGAEKAESLAEFITETWETTGRPCSRDVVELALDYAQRRRDAFSPTTSVLAHGDCHEANTLSVPGSAGTKFKFIDPDGLFIERAYDLGILMRGWGRSLLAGDAWALGRERAEMLAARSGVDAQPIWEWGFIERVSTGLVLKQLGAGAESREFLSVAEIWAAGDAKAHMRLA